MYFDPLLVDRKVKPSEANVEQANRRKVAHVITQLN